MLDNTERKIIEAFEKHEIKLDAKDILSKMPKKRKKSFDWSKFSKVLGIGFSTTAVAAALLIVFLPGNGSVEEQKKVINAKYCANLIGASNTLSRINPSSTIELDSNGNINQSFLTEVYERIESSVVTMTNNIDNEIEIIKNKTKIDDITYQYAAELTDSFYGLEYSFYYNQDESNDSINGILIPSLSNDYALFQIKVESTYKIVEENTLTESIFTPILLGFEVPCSYKVTENSATSITHTYYISEQEVFKSTINKISDSETKIEYSTLLGDYTFNVNKTSANTYEMIYKLFGFVEGKVIATYDLSNKQYSLEFQNDGWDFGGELI